MKLLALSLLLLPILTACTPPAEPPPEPPPTTTAPVEPPPPTTTAPPVEPPVEPPPEPGGRAPQDYPPLERVPGVVDDLNNALQENAWAGWRDPLYVVEHCADALQPNEGALFPMTSSEMTDFAHVGEGLDSEGAGFLERLPHVNKRCEESHPEHDARFCGRSDVLRSRLGEFRGRLTAHLEAARALADGLSGEPGYGSEFNSIAGWCRIQER